MDESRSASDVPIAQTPPPVEPPEPLRSTAEIPLDPINSYRHKQDVEELQSRQYWKPEWRTDANIGNVFNIGDASSLGQRLVHY